MPKENIYNKTITYFLDDLNSNIDLKVSIDASANGLISTLYEAPDGKQTNYSGKSFTINFGPASDVSGKRITLLTTIAGQANYIFTGTISYIFTGGKIPRSYANDGTSSNNIIQFFSTIDFA